MTGLSPLCSTGLYLIGLANYTALQQYHGMKNWNRFDDGDIVEVGNHTWKFEFPEGNYTLAVKQTRQYTVDVSHGEKTESWPVEVKEQKGHEFKLSGFAWATPEIGFGGDLLVRVAYLSDPQNNVLGRPSGYSK